MSILIYNWKDIRHPLVGGAEIITFEYARRLAADGHQVTWFCRAFAGGSPEETIDGVKVVRRGNILTTYLFGWLYYRSLPAKPTIVIDMLNTLAWQTPLYARASTVVQYINQLAKEVWDYELRPPLSWLGRLLEPLELIPYHQTPVLTYAASTAADLVAWGYNKNKIKIFSLGLDHSRYQPGQKAAYPLFLQVCRMVRMKRPDLTVRAFAQVVKRHPQARLALVGNGPYKPALTRLVRQLGLEGSVVMPDKDILFFKATETDQKVKLMQQAWAFVHPSVKEGWGMVLTEAAACGTPSIATAVTGQIDAVKNGETGLLINANPSVDELATAMLKLIEDQELRQRLSKGAIKWVAQFDWDRSYLQFRSALAAASQHELTALSPIPADQLPDISIITPVFNAAKVLDQFFAGLKQANYPADKLRLIMPDGGSTDATQKIALAHSAVLIPNHFKTAEAGKAEGVKYVLADIAKRQQDPNRQLICFLDSDNILTDPDWFQRMVRPLLEDQTIIGSEPWQYYRRSTDGPITRYTAMLGMSDPVVHWLGNYDRLNLLTGRWTGLPIRADDHGDYLSWTIDPKVVPTIGANGTLFRAAFFKSATTDQFLFDIDVLYQYTQKHKAKFAKVKLGLVHLFAGSVTSFIRKQQRRIKDYQYFQAMGLRRYPWDTLNKKGLVLFVLACVTGLPLLWQAFKGWARSGDPAWFFHPVACWITLWVYGSGRILAQFQAPALADRTDWSQG